MICSSLAYLRKKWLARKSEKNRWNNSPSWIDKRKVHKNDVTLNTEQRKEQEEIWERDGHKNGQDRLEKDMMPQSDKLRSWRTCTCSISFGLGPFFYHSLLWSECLINSGMNKTIPHKTNYHGTDNSRYSVDGTGVLISDNWQFIRRLVESTKIFIN